MKLSQWRSQKGKTQEWVAERAGVTQSFISLIERAIDPQVPRSDAFLKAIFILSEGAVCPNDFYDIPAWEAEMNERGAGTIASRKAA